MVQIMRVNRDSVPKKALVRLSLSAMALRPLYPSW